MVKCPRCKKGELLAFTLSEYGGVGSGIIPESSFKPEYQLKIRTVYRCTSCGQEFNIFNLPFRYPNISKEPRSGKGK